MIDDSLIYLLAIDMMMDATFQHLFVELLFFGKMQKP